jgi:hypothetical protein
MNPEIFKMMARGLKETPVAVSVPTSQEGRPKACYENSLVYMIGAKSMEYKYVLGIVDFRGVPIEHAWVKKDDGIQVCLRYRRFPGRADRTRLGEER